MQKRRHQQCLASNTDRKPIPQSISCLQPTVGLLQLKQKTICFEMIQKFTAEVPSGQIASAGVRNSTYRSKPYLMPCGGTHLTCCLPFLRFPVLQMEQQNLNPKSDPVGHFRKHFLLRLVFHVSNWEAVWPAVPVRLGIEGPCLCNSGLGRAVLQAEGHIRVMGRCCQSVPLLQNAHISPCTRWVRLRGPPNPGFNSAALMMLHGQHC